MTDDFALVDFALLRAPPAEVAQALAHIDSQRSFTARRGGREAGGPGSGTVDPAARRPGLFGRWFGARSGRAAPDGLLLHPARHLPPAPLARLMPDDLGFGAGRTPFRVTAPLGLEELTLVEYREGDHAASPIAAGLSKALAGIEVFYFRLSGLRHPGSETVFHIYRDGVAQRRAASICAEGLTTEAEWEVVDTGLPHLVEADSLPPARARAWDVMTPERQGAILAAMGIDPDTLFSPDPDLVTLELSAEPGGRPVHEAARMVERARARLAAKSRPTFVAEAEAAVAAPSVREALPQASPSRAPPPLEAPKPLLPAPPAAPPDAGETAPAPSESPRDERWETEVTRLLVTAVAHALPEDEQVPWLTRLTMRLEAGEVEAALAEAQELIRRGDRPAEERRADAERLNALFGAAPDLPQGP